MLSKRYVAVFGLALGLFALGANPARANVISAAPATVDCTGFHLCVTIGILDTATPLTFDFDFTLTPNSGPPIDVPGMVTFTPNNPVSETVCTDGTWPGSPLTEPVTVTGMASIPSEPPLTGFNPFTITFNGMTSIGLMCSTGTGCPATIGFWKNTKKHPFPPSVESSGLNIGGVTYSASQLLTILNAQGGGNAVAILGKQLVGALINIAAGAKDSMAADMAIADAENLLSMNHLNLLTDFVAPSSNLGQGLLADEAILNSYNSADFGTCSEGSGLTL